MPAHTSGDPCKISGHWRRPNAHRGLRASAAAEFLLGRKRGYLIVDVQFETDVLLCSLHTNGRFADRRFNSSACATCFFYLKTVVMVKIPTLSYSPFFKQ